MNQSTESFMKYRSVTLAEKKASLKQMVKLRPSKTGVAKLEKEAFITRKKKKQLSDLYKSQFSSSCQYFHASEPRGTQNHHPLYICPGQCPAAFELHQMVPYLQSAIHLHLAHTALKQNQLQQHKTKSDVVHSHVLPAEPVRQYMPQVPAWKVFWELPNS